MSDVRNKALPELHPRSAPHPHASHALVQHSFKTLMAESGETVEIRKRAATMLELLEEAARVSARAPTPVLRFWGKTPWHTPVPWHFTGIFVHYQYLGLGYANTRPE